MKVLSTRLTHNPWVSLVDVQIDSNILPKLLEHKSAASEMQCSKIGVANRLCNDLRRRAWSELNDTRRYTSFCEYLVDNEIGVGCCWGWFPDYNVANERGC